MGIFVKSPRQRAFCFRVKVQVSVAATAISPSRSPCQRTGFSQHRRAALSGLAHQIRGLPGGHVNDVQRSSSRLAPGDGPLDRFCLDEVRPGQGMQPCAKAFHECGLAIPLD
jgi:hypothetical protein